MKLGVAARPAVIGGLLILGCMAVVGVWNVRALMGTVERLTRWEKTLERLEEVVRAYRDAKNSLQVFFKTDDPRALEEYRRHSGVSQTLLNELRTSVDDEPQLRASLETLSSATVQLNDWLQRQIDAHQQLGASERTRLFSQEPADSPARRVVASSEEFKSLVRDRQRSETRGLQARSWWTVGVILGGSAGAAGVALFAAWSMRREMIQRRRTESQLRERESHWRAILDSEPECVKLLAHDGTLLEMNAAGLAMIQAGDGSQMLGQCVYPLILPEFQTAFRGLVERVFEGNTETLEFEAVGLKGHRLWLETHATPLRDEAGRIVSLLAITRDITDRQAIENALRDNEARLMGLVNSAMDGIITVDENRTIVLFNPAAEKIFRCSSAEAIGRSIDQFVPWQFRATHESAMREFAKSGTSVRQMGERRQVSGLRHDGTEFPAEASIVRVPVGDRRFLTVLLRDVTDRVRQEAALRESEQRLRMLVQASNIGLWDWDLITNAVFFSPEWKGQLGYEDEEIPGRYEEWERRLHPDDLAQSLQAVRDFREGRRQDYDVEFRLRHKDGSWRWILARADLIRDSEDRPIHMLGCHVDVTDRKQAETALRASEERFRALVENSFDAISLVRPDGMIQFVTPAATRILGYSTDEYLRMNSTDLLHPDDAPRATGLIRQVAETPGASVTDVHRMRHRDGSWRWIEGAATNLLHEPALRGIVINFRDITARKQAETALREAEVRLRTIFDLAPIGVVLIDPATAKVIKCNEVAARQLGYSREEFVRLRISDFDAIESPEQTRTHIERIRQDGRDEFETRHRTKSGEIRDVLVTTQIIDLSGRPVFHTIFLDITDRKRAEGIIREQERQLATLISSLPGFAYRCGTDADYSIEFVSDGIGDLTGYPADDFRSHRQHFGRLIHPADQEMVWNEIQAALRERRAYEFSYRVVTADGGEKSVWERGQGVFSANRDLLTLEGFVMDITAHKQTELALQASEERFRSFMDHLPAEAFIKDSAGRYIFGNKHWAENYPLPLESVLGKTDFELWPSRLAEMFQASDREVLRDGRAVEVQQTIEQDHGIAKWFQVLKFPIHQELAPPLVGGIALEITRLKQTEESMRQAANRLRALLATAQTVGATLDLDTLLNQLLYHVTQVVSITNRSAIYIYDPPTDVLIPRACIRADAETYRQIRLKSGESISGKVFQTGRSVLLRTRQEIDDLRGELRPENERLLALDRTGPTVRSTIGVPLRTRTGDNLGTMTLASTLGIFTEDDLSLLEGVASQAAIAIQNAELFDEVRAGRERLQWLSRQLIATQESERHHLARELHDEIGQVLTAVSLRLQNLKSGRDTDLQSEMDQGIQLIDQAIDQVRGLSLNLRPAMLDVLGLEPALRWFVNQQREQTGWDVRLMLQLESRLSPELEITCFRVVQGALTNISRHALASQVEVELRQSDLDLELSVRDNGIGFDLENARQRSEQGERFGLLAMRERVELVGGTFRIDSGSGQGTIIQAHFPLALMTQILE